MHYYAQIAYPYYIPVYWGFDLFEQNTLANLDWKKLAWKGTTPLKDLWKKWIMSH